jgi:DNA-binding response OmpR family regulator
MTAALLLAEPEPAIRGYLERQLQSDGFHVLQAAFGGEALALAERTRPDLVLCAELDLCARLREGEPGRTWNRDVPVIVLGPAGADAVDRVRAFQRGADDYLHRPVVYDELVARIRAVLRRVAPPATSRLEVGNLAIDPPARVVTVRGEAVHLAGKEFELLAALAAEPHRVFTKDELLRDVWGYRSFTRTRTLDSHVSRLRSKLERIGDDRFVVNVWGVGYKLVD